VLPFGSVDSKGITSAFALLPAACMVWVLKLMWHSLSGDVATDACINVAEMQMPCRPLRCGTAG
jgi:hypothetical protein